LDSAIFLAVLAAALLHASWNLIVKLNLDRFLALFLLQTLMGVMGVAMLLVFAWPNPASLPHAVASGVLHTGYNVFLARSYRTGDLSQVYPIARGSAPLLTLIVTWMVAGEAVTPIAAMAIGILVAGIWVTGFGGGKTLRLDGMTLFFALGTSGFIAAYTVVDGLGGRASGSASGYAALVFVLDAMFLNVAALLMRGPAVYRLVAPYWKSGVVGAALSAGAYWIVIWAMTRAPIAAVAALRETSILFVMGMSGWILRERVSWPRLAGGILIVAGAAALRFS
jgi:drug/metabolite transporter (DMT)-like permease